MPAPWRDDAELFALMRGRLFPAVVGDILDTMGHLHQFLRPQIRPLRPDMVVVGRAMTVLESDCFAAVEPAGHGPLSGQPFGLQVIGHLHQDARLLADAQALEQLFAASPALARPRPDLESLRQPTPSLRDMVTHPPLPGALTGALSGSTAV